MTQRVLVVDDEPGLVEAMTMALAREDREVVGCRSFAQARDRLLTEQFHVLLTDVRLGAFNGIQLAIIALDRTPGIRVVVFSGFDDPVLREEATRLGAHYLVKPVTAEQLTELIGDT